MSTILPVAGKTEPDGRAVTSEEEAEREAARHAGLVAARRLSAARVAGAQTMPLTRAEHATSPSGGEVALAEPPDSTAAGPSAGPDASDEPPEPPDSAEPHPSAGPDTSDGQPEPLGRLAAIERELNELEMALEQIDDGLVRFDAEDYGTCAVCRAEIPVAELAADPYLRTCSSHRPAPGSRWSGPEGDSAGPEGHRPAPGFA